MLVSASVLAQGTGGVPCQFPPGGMIAWWRAEGNADDTLGLHSGKLNNGASFAPGEAGLGFLFDGVDDFISVPDAPMWNFGPSDFSIELWVKWNKVKPSTFIHRQRGTEPGGWEFGLRSSPATGGFLLWFAYGSAINPAQSEWAPAANRWYHIGIARSQSVVRLYVDGAQFGVDQFDTTPVNDVPGPLRIGSRAGGGFEMDGQIDELSIYQRALGPDEFNKIALAGAAGKCPCDPLAAGMVAAYRFDNSINDSAGAHNPSDSSGVSFAATPYGAGISFAQAGATGYIEIPPALDLANQNFTLAAFARPDGAGPQKDNLENTIIAKMFTSGFGYSIGWRVSDERFVMLCGDASKNVIASANVFPVGKAHHVAGTFDGQGFRLYVDGVEEAFLASTSQLIFSTTEPWSIGNNPASIRAQGLSRTWNGIIDELAIYNRALTAAEIQTLRSSALPVPCQPGSSAPVEFGTPSALPPASTGQLYVQPLVANGGAPPYTFDLVSGRLPDGFTLSKEGKIQGLTTAPEASSFTARVTDTIGKSATKDFTLVVNSAVPTDYTWIAEFGDWSDPQSWTPAGIPGPQDRAFIPNGVVRVDDERSVRELNLSGGIITGVGTIRVRNGAELNWSFGGFDGGGLSQEAGPTTQTGTIDVEAAGTINVKFAAPGRLFGWRLRNQGSVNWDTDNTLVAGRGANIENSSGGTFKMRGMSSQPFDLSETLTSGLPNTFVFFNSASATLIKGPDTKTLQFNSPLINEGTVRVEGGTLGTGSSADRASGGFNILAGATLDIGGGTLLNNGASFTGAGLVRFGNVTVAATAVVTVQRAEVVGLVSGPGQIRLPSGGTMSWTTGSFQAAGLLTIESGATLEMILSSTSSLFGWKITNSGVILWSASTPLAAADKASIDNQQGGLVRLQGTATRVFAQNGEFTFINRLGAVIARIPNAAPLTFGGTLLNDGLVRVEGGAFSVGTGSDRSTGEFQTLAGATLNIGNGAQLSKGAKFTGPGMTRFGSLILGPGADVPLQHGELLDLITGTGTLRVPTGADLNWTTGSFGGTAAASLPGTGTLRVDAGGTLNVQIPDSGTASLTAAQIMNQGTIDWNSAGTMALLNNSSIDNLAGGVVRLRGMAASLFKVSDSLGFFNRDGATIIKGPDADLLQFDAPLINAGLVRIEGGTFKAGTSADRITGEIQILKAAILSISGGSRLGNGARFTGEGLARVGAVNLEAGAVIPAPRVELTGQITGPGTLRAPAGAQFRWTTATFDGTQFLGAGGGPGLLDIDEGATLVMNLASGAGLNAWKLFNRGTIKWEAGVPLVVGSGAAIENQKNGLIQLVGLPTSLIDVQGDFSFINRVGGAIVKGPDTGELKIGAALINQGRLEVQGGILNFPRLTQLSGTTLLSGTALIAPVADFQGGSLTGSGTIRGNVQSDASIVPGTPIGTFLIEGNYTQTAGGVLVIDLAGLASGRFDTLNITGIATLGGLLQVRSIDGYVPRPGNFFTILSAAAVAGTFGTTVSQIAGLQTLYGDADVRLAIAALPAAKDPPQVTSQPTDQDADLGKPINLGVGINSATTPKYQWRRNGAKVPGADQSILGTPAFDLSFAGAYTVTTVNDSGVTQTRIVKVLPKLPLLAMSDAFAARTVLTDASGSRLGKNSGATRETGEPFHDGKPGRTSVWIGWRAPATGLVTFSTLGSVFDTLLAAYTGTAVNSLTEVASDDDQGSFYTSAISFNAIQGVEYAIAVDGRGGASGEIALTWTFSATPDSLPRIVTQPLSQIAIAGQTVTLKADVTGPVGMTFQWFVNGAPVNSETQTALTLANVTTQQIGSYVLQVSFAGRTITSDAALVQIASDPTNARNGVTALDKFLDASTLDTGNPRAGLSSLRSPPWIGEQNAPARGFSGTQIFSTVGAQSELGEPLHCGNVGGASQWFAYQADADGTLAMNTSGSNFAAVIAVYTGSGTDFETLVSVTCSLDGSVSFTATKNTIYYIAVDGRDGATGLAQVNYLLTPPTPPVSSGPITLKEAGIRANDQALKFLIEGARGRALIIQESTDLQNWSQQSTQTPVTDSVELVIPGVVGTSHRFYRVRVQ